MIAALLSLAVISAVRGQQSFALPQAVRGPSLPTVDEDLVKYFDLTGGSRPLVDMLVGQRPGIIPPANFQVPGSECILHQSLTPISQKWPRSTPHCHNSPPAHRRRSASRQAPV